MIEDGLLRRFPCATIFGIHNRPGMPLGKFLRHRHRGRGAHGARPEAGVDPLLIAAHVTTAENPYLVQLVHEAYRGR